MRRCRALATYGLGLLLVSLVAGTALTTGAARAGASEKGVLQGNGSVDEAWMIGAKPGDSITLLHDGARLADSGHSGRADSLGALIIRNVTPGRGYSWEDTTSGDRSPSFSVLAPGADPPTDGAL